ncbi:hypothetical protein GOP47_0001038 [Adiantum capillus-veneris]|uniref:Uncharacterized protein n=1 Tax=Adiantum capillus-veneris TaxID=13818 RepID=A0A9D4VEE9_ADICA|nr:hypothetical protein GOP47_0001038 [Adiantum capillus-veneris]
MAGLAAVIPSAFRSWAYMPSPSRLPTRRAHGPFQVNARLEASEKKRRKQTVYEEDVYNIDTGPELSTKEIIALAGVQVPKRLVQQLEKEKKKGKTVVQKEAVLVRKTHKLLRVIAGKASGKKLLSIADASVRPMMEVVRGAVFDILQARLHGIRKLSAGGSWLDLYSGTGSVGIEALSRGCSSAHFVEMDPWIATNVLKANIENTDFSELSVVHVMKTESFLQQAPRPGREPFDFISVTPPYEAVDYNILMGQLSTSYVLGKETFVVVEYPSEVEIIEGCGPLVKILNRRYGRTHLAIYGPEWAAKS